MLSNERDRPLPSQIYQLFEPYRSRILAFKGFQFAMPRMEQWREDCILSNASRAYYGDVAGRDMGGRGGEYVRRVKSGQARDGRVEEVNFANKGRSVNSSYYEPVQQLRS